MTAVERAMLHLVRLVVVEDWDAATAASQLLDAVADPRVLRVLAARVEVARADRASQVADRAVQTLRVALDQSCSVDPGPAL